MRAHPAGVRHADFAQVQAAQPLPLDSFALHALDPALWPSGAARGADGAISIAGCSLTQLAQQYGTPLLVCDERDFRQRCRVFSSTLGPVAQELGTSISAYYASKAFLSADVARWVRQEGLGLDVCSLGELQLALQAGCPPEKIVMHGNNKSLAYLQEGVDAGVGRIVIDSFDEVERLASITAQRQRRVKVLVRVTVGVEAHTHDYIATAHEDQKFGFSLAAGCAVQAVARVLEHSTLQLVGLHTHIGSQIFDPSGFEMAAHRMVGLMLTVRDEHGLTVEELNMGGGFGIAYSSTHTPQPAASIVTSLLRIIVGECQAAGLPLPQVAVEPGRSIIGPSMITVYEVGTVKKVSLEGGSQRTYVSVDGGMSDNIRPALYGAVHTVTLANRISRAQPMRSRVVGHHCETGDVLADAWLAEDCSPGDLLAVAATGAYSYAMASNYNFSARPAVVGVRQGQSALMVRRQTLQELLATDCGMSR